MNTKSDILLQVECKEPEGTFLRTVKLCELSMEKLHYLYEKLSQFKVLFNTETNDINDFIQSFISIDAAGEPHAIGILYEIDDVGVIRFTDIFPGNSADFHATFWDRRIRGREELMRRVISNVMNLLDLHRVTCFIPLYAQPALGAIERVGFKKEGRLREASLFKERWYDVNAYSILRQEV